MHKRLSAAGTNAAVSSIDKQGAVQLKKFASIDKKKRSKPSRSSVSIPVLSLFILLAGVLLLRTSWFNASDVKTELLSEDRKVAAFMDWFRAAGGNVSDKIAIQTFSEMGRGG